MLHRIWLWNLQRAELQQRLGEAVFVPRIGFYLTPQGLVSAAVWADGIPVVLPKAECVILYRDELAPVRWLRRRPGPAVVPWAEAEGHLTPYRHESEPVDHWYVDSPERSGDIVAWFKGSELAVELQAFPMDEVLDSEVVAAARESLS